MDRAAHRPAMRARALTALATVHIAGGNHHTSLLYAVPPAPGRPPLQHLAVFLLPGAELPPVA